MWGVIARQGGGSRQGGGPLQGARPRGQGRLVLGDVDGQVQDAPGNAHGVVGGGQAGPDTGCQAAPAQGSRHGACQPAPIDNDVNDKDQDGRHLVERER
jgi:hypothetical protein